MAPLYLAVLLGYASVKWWRMFNSDQCAAINFVCYFVFPFYGFSFISDIDPFSMNYKYLGADIMSKFVTVLGFGIWCKCCSRADCFGWFVTCFTLCTMTNSLFVGVPLMNAMYGPAGVNLVVQATVLQIIVYGIVFLILLEFWKSLVSSKGVNPAGNSNAVPVGAAEEDLEGHGTTVTAEETMVEESERPGPPPPSSFWPLMRNALLKLRKNPNIYACVLGLIWPFLAKWLHIGMPTIVEGSIKVLSAGGTSTAMAAMPEALAAFVFANEYGLHTDVISTAEIFGMIICLPLLIAYYAILAYIK